jgi:hypothetical protein
MSVNKVSAVLPDADKAAVITSVGQIKKTLPFLISVNAEERHDNRKMGAKSVEYVNLNLQGTQSFGNLIPANVNIAEFAKDVTLVNQLSSIRIELASLLESIDDTMLVAGSDAMVTADQVYGYLKAGAKTNAAVKALVAEIAKRFKGQGKKKAA